MYPYSQMTTQSWYSKIDGRTQFTVVLHDGSVWYCYPLESDEWYRTESYQETIDAIERSKHDCS